MADFYQSVLFATDLVEYVLVENNLYWKDPNKSLYMRKVSRYNFDQVIGEAIFEVTQMAPTSIINCFKRIFDRTDYSSIGKLILDGWADLFPPGYTAAYFLSFCSVMAGFAIILCETGAYAGIPCIINVIATVLRNLMENGQFQKNGGMQELILAGHKVSYYLLRIRLINSKLS